MLLVMKIPTLMIFKTYKSYSPTSLPRSLFLCFSLFGTHWYLRCDLIWNCSIRRKLRLRVNFNFCHKGRGRPENHVITYPSTQLRRYGMKKIGLHRMKTLLYGSVDCSNLRRAYIPNTPRTHQSQHHYLHTNFWKLFGQLRGDWLVLRVLQC